MKNTIFFIAFRYWRVKSSDNFGRLVSLLAGIGIILGITALIVVLSVMNGLENMQKQRLLSTIPHVIVSKQQDNFTYNNYTLPKQPITLRAVPINTTDVIVQSKQDISAGKLLGVKKINDDQNLMNYSQQELDQLLAKGSYNIIISNNLMQQLNLTLGQKIRLLVTDNSQYTPFGRIPVQRLFTVVDSFMSTNNIDRYQMYANIVDVGRLIRINADTFKSLRLFLDEPFQVNKLNFANQDYQVYDWRIQQGEFFQAVKMEKNIMGLLISLIILVAISNIITSISLMVIDKQGEIAILRTLGLTAREIMYIFILQGLLVGFVATIFGVILGLAITYNFNYLNQLFSISTLHLPILINNSQIILIILGSICLSWMATLYPAYRAAHIQPAEALRYE